MAFSEAAGPSPAPESPPELPLWRSSCKPPCLPGLQRPLQDKCPVIRDQKKRELGAKRWGIPSVKSRTSSRIKEGECWGRRGQGLQNSCVMWNKTCFPVYRESHHPAMWIQTEICEKQERLVQELVQQRPSSFQVAPKACWTGSHACYSESGTTAQQHRMPAAYQDEEPQAPPQARNQILHPSTVPGDWWAQHYLRSTRLNIKILWGVSWTPTIGL